MNQELTYNVLIKGSFTYGSDVKEFTYIVKAEVKTRL